MKRIFRLANLLILNASIVILALLHPAYAMTDAFDAVDYLDVASGEVPVASTETVAADILIARPIGIGATAVGIVLFVLSLPFSILAGDVQTPAEQLIGVPAETTFIRPLGIP
jgi:hypothetical protein